MDIQLSRLARPFVDLDFPGLVRITMGAGYFVRLRIALPDVDIPHLARRALRAPTLSVPAHLGAPDGSEGGRKLQKKAHSESGSRPRERRSNSYCARSISSAAEDVAGAVTST